MRIAPAQRRAYTYKVTTAPAQLAVSLETTKKHLVVTESSRDAIITIYLKATIDVAEKLSKRDFITRTYRTFRDFFPGISEGYYQFGNLPSLGSIANTGGNLGFEIRRSPFQSVVSVKYLKSGVLTTVPSADFYNTLETDYSEILTNEDKEWPDDADRRLQAIEIDFKSGFGDGASDSEPDTPDWAIEGILQHVAQLFANRGDCPDQTSAMNALPSTSKLLYLQNRIENL